MVAITDMEGAYVLNRLQAALRDAEAESSRCKQDAERLEGEVHDLLARRGDALLKLAKLYLPEVSRPAIESTFAAIREDLLAILERKEATRNQLQDQLGHSEGEAARLEEQLNGATAKLNAMVERRERLEAQVAEILKANADFQERSKLAIQAEQNLHRNEQRVREIQAEAGAKLPHYDKSKLFRYLYDRGYGTSEYSSKGWAREIDDWVARKIGFGEARVGYEFLKKTPGLVAEEVARRKEQFDALMAQVDAIQQSESEKAGLTAVMKEGEELGVERDRLVREIAARRQAAEGVKTALASLAQAQNQFYAEAVERFRGFLGEAKLVVLQQRARETAGREDDAIVGELAELDRRIDDMQPRLAAESRQRQAADRAQAGLDRVIRRFHESNYDSQRSCFTGGFDVDAMLASYHQGVYDEAMLWRTITDAQRFRPHWVESTVETGTQVMANPAGRVLMGAILDVASVAMQQAAARGVQRRAHSSPSFPSATVSFPSPPATPAPPDTSSGSSDYGFTSGEGF